MTRSSSRPNVLILYTDQQRWDALGANGNREIKTPVLDSLVREGVNFDRHFVQNPVCMPSRVSFLTGQYPSTLRIEENGVPVPEDTVTLAHMLKPYGYTCGNLGKIHFLPHANRDHRTAHPAYGFDHMEISDEPGCYEDAYRAWVRGKAPEEMDKISPRLPPAAGIWQKAMGGGGGVKHPEGTVLGAVPFRSRSDLTHTAFVAERTIEFMRANKERPFMCIAGFYSPHEPWIAPQEFLDLYDLKSLKVHDFPPEINAKRGPDRFPDEQLRSVKQGYYAMVSEVDHHVGRILKALDELSLSENTLVIFTSDHGEWLGEHLRYGKGFWAPDCVSRVPLIMRFPKSVRAEGGRRISDLVEAVDVMPTILECAGVQVPPHLQGSSLLGLIRGGAPGRPSALTEMAGARTLRMDRYRYVITSEGKEMLFDLEADPGEYRSVAGEGAQAQALSEARKEMARRIIALERPLPRTWQY